MYKLKEILNRAREEEGVKKPTYQLLVSKNSWLIPLSVKEVKEYPTTRKHQVSFPQQAKEISTKMLWLQNRHRSSLRSYIFLFENIYIF